MCTAVTYRSGDFYFGRNLDYDYAFGECVAITPRKFPLPFRHTETVNDHYSIIGMAHIEDNYPLYYDAINEKGLAIAGLNFVGNAVYNEEKPNMVNIAIFEFIPWILAQCASVKEAIEILQKTNLTNTAFSSRLPTAQLHWLVADKEDAITIESTKVGLQIDNNPIGILTNNPPFEQQMLNLSNYMHLSPYEGENTFAPDLSLTRYSRGMGAIGLPGDLSSQSRFVRAAFTKLNSISDKTEASSVNQLFHILGSVRQTRGCCRLDLQKNEITLYTSCCNADKGIYYYTTYDNLQISAINMHHTDLNGSKLVLYPLITESAIHWHN